MLFGGDAHSTGLKLTFEEIKKADVQSDEEEALKEALLAGLDQSTEAGTIFDVFVKKVELSAADPSGNLEATISYRGSVNEAKAEALNADAIKAITKNQCGGFCFTMSPTVNGAAVQVTADHVAAAKVQTEYTVPGKCAGNATPYAGVTEQVEGKYQVACGDGFHIKADAATIELPLEKLVAACCDGRCGGCSP